MGELRECRLRPFRDLTFADDPSTPTNIPAVYSCCVTQRTQDFIETIWEGMDGDYMEKLATSRKL
jgi:hypothetical protein